MHTAKIIRHRHKYLHTLNDDIKDVEEDTHFKIVFSDPGEMTVFEKWVKDRQGEYKYDKEKSKQKGTMPDVKDLFGDQDICWCDIMTFYILHVIGYRWHEHISPYKGEVYIKP